MKFICGAIYRVKNEPESYGMMLATEMRKGISNGLFQRFGHAPMRINDEYNGGMDYKPRYDRLRALLFCQGSPSWLDADDLEVVSGGR